jgi:hypothetical protein
MEDAGNPWSRFAARFRKEYSWAWLRKEFSSWATKGVFTAIFSLAIGGVVYVFTMMTAGSFFILVVCTFLLIASGFVIVRQAVREVRKPGPRKKDHARAEEMKRRKQIRKLFQEFIDEAERGDDWTDGQFGNWISRIEHAIRPLMEAEVTPFLHLFGRYKEPLILTAKLFEPSVAEKRRDCVTWLRATLYKYWV